MKQTLNLYRDDLKDLCGILAFHQKLVIEHLDKALAASRENTTQLDG